jgi:serine/threonine protein kinase
MEGDLQPGDPSQIGPYRLLAVLGSGGMGRVYLGRSPAGRLVAVKVIRAELAADQDFRVRFRREVAAARQVSGLYTASVVDADVDGRLPWLATAYVPGQSLADAVTRGGALPPDELRVLALGLAEGLAAIHAAGLVHRDLKPSNVLLSDDGPRVIDFGISRAMEASALTVTGVIIGTPGFMSPEQAEGRAAGPASDVFSLGAMLAFAATGRGPFGGGEAAALLYRVVHAAPGLDGVPTEFRALIGKCLAKDPNERPPPAGIIAELRDASPAERPQPDVASLPPVTEEPASAAAWPPTVDAPGPGTPPSPAMAAGRPRRRQAFWVTASAGTTVAAAAAIVITLAVLSPPSAAPRSSARPPGTAAGSIPPSRGRPGTASPVGRAGQSVKRYAFGSPDDIINDGAHIWVADDPATGTGSVTEIDARTGARIRVLSGPHITDPSALASDGAHIWVANGGHSIDEFNASDGTWVRTLLPLSAYPAPADPDGLLPTGGRLWMAQPTLTAQVQTVSGVYRDTAAWVVNVSDGSIVASLGLGAHGLGGVNSMAAADSQVWIATGGGGIVSAPGASADFSGLIEYNASSGSFVRAIPVGAFQDMLDVSGMAIYGDHIWIMDADAGSMVEVSAASGAVERSVSLATSRSGAGNNSSTMHSIVTYGPHMLVAWGDSVTELDAATGAVVRTFTGASYGLNGAVAIAVAENQAWVASARGGSGNNGSVTEFPVT